MIAAQPGMAMPQRVGGADPVYTDLALAEGTSGSVKLEVTVGSDGLVQNVHLIQGLPHGLSEAAIRAAKEWEFEPARQFGDYVEITIQVAIAFGLFDSAPQNLNASVLSEIEPLLPKSTILTSLTSEGELLHIEGTIADSIEATKLLENINNSTSFSQPFLESMTPVDEAIQFHITCERTN